MNDNENKVFLGIDPGVSGAWALMSNQGEILNAGLWDQRDALLHGLRKGLIPALTCLEKVGVRPTDGKDRVGKFMRVTGFWDGVFESFDLRNIEAVPQKWQKKILDAIPAKEPKDPNETAKEMSQRLAKNKKRLKEYITEFVKKRYPGASKFITLKKHQGIADAICLADYARKHQ